MAKGANKQLKQRLKSTKRWYGQGDQSGNKVMPVVNAAHLDLLMYGEAEKQINTPNVYWHDCRHRDVMGVMLNSGY